MSDRRDYDPKFDRFILRVKIAGAVVAVVQSLVFGFWWHEYETRRADDAAQAAVIADQAASLARQVERIDDLTMRLHDDGCASFDTLHRLIGKQRLNRPALRLLGFTDAQIAGAAKEVQKQKDKTLALLGERDPTCPPVKEKP